MTTSDEELDRMEAAILTGIADPEIAASVPDWTAPDDPTRIGIDTMIATDRFGRAVSSRGNIRITGDGVIGHSAKANDIARIVTGFQRLATALGASGIGDKELGKQANADVRRRTDLLLTAAPGPGSIILTFAPALSFIDEAGAPGMILELETDEQMLDTAIGAAVDVFTAGNEIGASPDDSAFVTKLGDLGPRSASAVRDLAKTLDRAGFDIEVDWQ